MFNFRLTMLAAVIFAANVWSARLFAANKSSAAQNQTSVHSYGYFVDSQSGALMYGHHYIPATQARSASVSAFTAPAFVQSSSGLVGLSPGFFSNAGNIPIASQSPAPDSNTPAPDTNCNTTAVSDTRKRINDANDILASLESKPKNNIKLDPADAPAAPTTSSPTSPTTDVPAPVSPAQTGNSGTPSDISDLIQTLLTTVLKGKLSQDELNAVLQAIKDATNLVSKSPTPAQNNPNFLQTVLGTLLKSAAVANPSWPNLVEVILGALFNGAGAGAQSAGTVDYKAQLEQLSKDFQKANIAVVNPK